MRNVKKIPAFPHYTVTYDVKYFLDYVKKCSISSETSLELTSKILATMMCLLSGRRSQTLFYLSTDGKCLIIQGVPKLFKVMKNFRSKSHQQPIV